MKFQLNLLFSLLLLCNCINAAGEPGAARSTSTMPDYPIVSKIHYEGTEDDLLTGGLGIAGLQAKPPGFADPMAPARSELRRNSIHYNFNALVNTVTTGGFGRLYGPFAGRDKFTGYEYLSYVRDQESYITASLLVQIPDSFDTSRPCIVVGPSSGSRGIYGAIGVVGPWALRNGCALAFTDKGTGTGFYNIETGESYNLWGEYGQHSPGDSLFSLAQSPALDEYRTAFPNRIAIKHAHSGTNSEKHWPRYVLNSINFAFQVLNTHYRDRPEQFIPGNTIVIASGTSNGGGSSVRAAELDRSGLIDAVVVAEPNLNMPADNDIRLVSGGKTVTSHSRKLLDYTTHTALYLPCALLSKSLSDGPFYQQIVPLYRVFQEGRCASLHKKGLLESATLNDQVREALHRLHEYGVREDSHLLDASFVAGRVWEGLSAVYTNAYGRYAIDEHACGVSFAVMDQQGRPAPMDKQVATGLAAISSGFIGTGGIGLSVDPGGAAAVEIFQSRSEAGVPDMGLQTAVCWRRLLASARVQKGLEEIAVSGDLHGKPVIIVHGRQDSLIHVNHASRPYFGLNKKTGLVDSRLHYYEIENAQHFDGWLKFPEVARHFVPLQFYLEQSLDRMLEYLLTGRALAPSQVVRTDPATFASDAAPVFSMSPGHNQVFYKDNTVHIP